MGDTDETSETRWDLATGIGATAMMLAAARARATSNGEINDPFAEPLIRALGVDFYQRVASGEAYPSDDGGGATAELLVAGTRYFDDLLAAAGRAGIQQVVILASGLDTRPYRLWWPAGTIVYELDQPQVLEFKTQTVRALGAAPTGHRRAVGVDLRQDWPAALRQIGFDAAQPTVWIAEGLVLGSLTVEAAEQLLDRVTALSVTGSRFAADLDVPERPYTQTVGERHEAVRYLQTSGWATESVSAADVVAATGSLTWSAATAGGVRAPIGYVSATRR